MQTCNSKETPFLKEEGFQGEKAFLKRLCRNFERSLPRYQKTARIQRKMASTLAHELKPYLTDEIRILELGVGTGLLTREILDLIHPSLYLAVDLLPAYASFLKDLPVNFVVANAEEPSFLKGKFELIVSNATFQWFRTPTQVVEHYHAFLSSQGILALSTFGPQTMQEIRPFPLPGLQPFSAWQKARQGLFKPLFERCWRETVFFPSPLEILRHIRHTGARGSLPSCWSMRRLRRCLARCQAQKTEKGYPLSYEPIILIWQKL